MMRSRILLLLFALFAILAPPRGAEGFVVNPHHNRQGHVFPTRQRQRQHGGVVVVETTMPIRKSGAKSTTTSVPTMMMMMLDPTMTASAVPDISQLMIETTAATTAAASVFSSSSSLLLLSFTDQGQNLAGIFFQASLLPYLLFLYFLQFRANRLSTVTNFGFQFILLFVLSTIPSGIICRNIYGHSLADTDWLHGSAESLLTIANVLIVLGFTQAMTKNRDDPLPNVVDDNNNKARNLALGAFGLFTVICAAGTIVIGLDGHAPFLFGLGNLPQGFVQSLLPFINNHKEPINALSIPTWAIHYSSVLEYVFAMNLVWQFADITKNEKWKGLTWGMLPLHASGICACTYHFFYNPSNLQFLVTSQAGLTLLGNITCMIAAFRIAQSNGWTVDEINPFPRSSTSPQGLVADGIAATPLDTVEAKESNEVLVAKLVTLTLLLSYGTKYGELALDLPFNPNPIAAAAIILGIPSLTAYYYYDKSERETGEKPRLSLPSFGGNNDGKPSLSMSDVKKYGVAGTVAYILTEIAFWAVAFPAAAYALYESTGHWPDVINDNGDRAAVFGFIFAGANIARAFVPVRLGAALALAPWVDENLLSGKGQADAAAAAEVGDVAVDSK